MISRVLLLLLGLAGLVAISLPGPALAADPLQEYQEKLRQWERDKKYREEKAKQQLLQAEKRNQAVSGGAKSGQAPANEARGVPIVAVGAVISAHDTKHLLDALKELARTVKPAQIGIVYVVGSLQSLAPDEFVEAFESLGAAPIKFVSSIPEGLNIKRSPTWIVHTVQGRVLLEGIKLASRINSQAEFVEKGVAAR